MSNKLIFTSKNNNYDGIVALNGNKLRPNVQEGSGNIRLDWQQGLFNCTNHEINGAIQDGSIDLFVECHCPSSGYRKHTKLNKFSHLLSLGEIVGDVEVSVVGVAANNVSVTLKNGLTHIFRRGQKVIMTEPSTFQVKITSSKAKKSPLLFRYQEGTSLGEYEFDISYMAGEAIEVNVGSKQFQNEINSISNSIREKDKDPKHYALMEGIYFPVITEIILHYYLENPDPSTKKWVRKLDALGWIPESHRGIITKEELRNNHTKVLKEIRKLISNSLYGSEIQWAAMKILDSTKYNPHED